MSASAVLLIRPACFGFNAEAAETNHLQQAPRLDESALAIRDAARAELDRLAGSLQSAGLDVLVVEDDPTQVCPDAVFPNNWLSTYDDGTLMTHAMAVVSRRAERREAVVEAVAARWRVARRIDLASGPEGEVAGAFLEGTGSVVLDRDQHIAYACRSPRTTEAGLRRYAAASGYHIYALNARDRERAPYHTNVMLSIGPGYAVVSAGVCDDTDEARLIRQLDRPVLRLNAEEHAAFGANQLHLHGRRGEPLILLSETALGVMRPESRRFLEGFGTILPGSVPTIERIGGGSVRCMVAEILLSPRVPAEG